jgi:uncharacterized protein YjiS (DUF1127 family)
MQFTGDIVTKHRRMAEASDLHGLQSTQPLHRHRAEGRSDKPCMSVGVHQLPSDPEKMDARIAHSRRAAARCRALVVAAMLSGWWQTLRRWGRHRNAIAALQALDGRMLKDIGIERSEIESVVRGLDRDRSRKARS